MRTVTLSDLARRIRFHCDQRASSFVSDQDMLDLINDRYAEFYDVLVDAYEDYYSAFDTFNIGPGQADYDLPADFYKVLGVDFRITQDNYVTLKPYPDAERNKSFTSVGALPSGEIRLRYVKAPAVFTAMTDTFDGVAGWERLVILGVSIDIMNAEESDSRALQRQYDQTFERLVTMSHNRDAGMPGRIADAYTANILNMYGAIQYAINGDQLSFISTEYLVPAPGSGFYWY